MKQKHDNFNDALLDVADHLVRTLEAKRHDYGVGNISKFGQYGILVRISDKLERLINLIDKNPKVADETALDTWLDLAGYALIGYLYSKGWYELKDK
jgi:hypothetical protein